MKSVVRIVSKFIIHGYFARGLQLFVVLVFTGFPALPAQILPFHTYTSKDGLLSNYILDLCTDSRGYLWIGTNDGLSSYDGISFHNYTVADGLPFSRVNVIHESRRHPGTLWIATNGGGVCKFVDQHFTAYRTGSTSMSNTVNTIIEDYTGRIWAASSQGIFVMDDSVFIPFRLDSPPTEYSNLIETPDSSVWIIIEEHVYSYSPQTQRMHEVRLPLAENTTFQVPFVDGDQTIWLTTSGGIIFKLKNEKLVDRIRTGSHDHFFIVQSDSGTFWVGVTGGILRIDEHPSSVRRMTRYTTRNGLPDTAIVSALVDREGDLWIGNYSKGISKLSDPSVVTYSLHPRTYAPNNTTALCDKNDHLWVCSDGYLWEYWMDENSGWRNVRHDEIAKGKHRCVPSAITMDGDANFWIVSGDRKIFEYRVQRTPRGSLQLKQLKEFIPGVHFPRGIPMFVFRDDNGLLWCSMSDDKGIFLLDPSKRNPFLRIYTTKDGMPDESVRAIYQDKKGNLWFGGYSDGLSMLSADESLDKHLRIFSSAHGLPNNAIRAVIEDATGTLWVGTRYGGLAYFQDSVFHPVSVREGLLSTAVWCLARRSQGDLWIGTQLGIQSLTPASLAFSTKAELNGNPAFSCGQMSNGMFWFVSTAGLTIYNPATDRRNVTEPPVSITRFQVNGVDFPTKGSFTLSSNQDNCALEVAGVSLHDEGGLRYQYRLLGANAEWWPPSSVRTFVFGTLAPGAYTFQVRALNASGVVSAKPATLEFTILPPFWKQWWFIVGTVLCLILAAVGVVRLRLVRLLAIERLRSRIATDLHDDIGSGLTRIAILADVAYKQIQTGETGRSPGEHQKDEVLRGLQKVTDTARGLIEAMSDVVWAINPAHDSFERLVQRLRSFAYELCEGKNIKLRFNVADNVLTAKMSSEGMRNVLLLAKEALANIAKHSRCTNAELSMKVDAHQLIVAVEDNGRGFDVSLIEPGNGLANMRKRTLNAGGSFELNSGTGKGTQIVASFLLSS